jgi:hypothetical protein
MIYLTLQSTLLLYNQQSLDYGIWDYLNSVSANMSSKTLNRAILIKNLSEPV